MKQPAQKQYKSPEALFELFRKTIFQSMKASVYQKYDDCKLNFSQRNALLIIDGKKSVTPGELARNLAQKTPSIARLVRSLERRNLITRTENNYDRRERLLKLTPLAQELIKKADRTPVKNIREMYLLLSDKEKQTICTGLQILSEGFKNISKRC